MSTFNGTADQIENNTLKVSEINDNNPEGAYPSAEAVKAFIAQYTADYIAETGVAEIDGTVWTYEKWNSGKAVCYCSATATYLNVYLLTFRSALPIEMTSTPLVFLTMKTGGTGTATGENLAYEMNRDAKYTIAANGDVRVFVQDVDGGMASDTTATVNIFVIGQWK